MLALPRYCIDHRIGESVSLLTDRPFLWSNAGMCIGHVGRGAADLWSAGAGARGDTIRIDANARSLDLQISDGEWRRSCRGWAPPS